MYFTALTPRMWTDSAGCTGHATRRPGCLKACDLVGESSRRACEAGPLCPGARSHRRVTGFTFRSTCDSGQAPPRSRCPRVASIRSQPHSTLAARSNAGGVAPMRAPKDHNALSGLHAIHHFQSRYALRPVAGREPAAADLFRPEIPGSVFSSSSRRASPASDLAGFFFASLRAWGLGPHGNAGCVKPPREPRLLTRRGCRRSHAAAFRLKRRNNQWRHT